MPLTRSLRVEPEHFPSLSQISQIGSSTQPLADAPESRFTESNRCSNITSLVLYERVSYLISMTSSKQHIHNVIASNSKNYLWTRICTSSLLAAVFQMEGRLFLRAFVVKRSREPQISCSTAACSRGARRRGLPTVWNALRLIGRHKEPKEESS